MENTTPVVVLAILTLLSALTAWLIFKKDLLVSWGKVTLGLGVLVTFALVGLLFLEVRNYALVDDDQKIYIVNINRSADGQFLIEFVNTRGKTESVKVAGDMWQLKLARMQFGPALSWADQNYYYRLGSIETFNSSASEHGKETFFPVSVIGRVVEVFDAVTLHLFFQKEMIDVTKVPLVDGALININQIDQQTLVIEPINTIATKHFLRHRQ